MPRPLRIALLCIALAAVVLGPLAAATDLLPPTAHRWIVLALSALIALREAIPALYARIVEAPAVEPPRVADAVVKVGVVLLALSFALPAHADEPAPAPQPAPVLVAAPVLPPVVAPAPLTDAERVALAVKAAQAGLVAAQQGIQTAPVLKSWSETRAGQVVLGCIAGAIVVTSAAGAVAGVWVAAR